MGRLRPALAAGQPAGRQVLGQPSPGAGSLTPDGRPDPTTDHLPTELTGRRPPTPDDPTAAAYGRFENPRMVARGGMGAILEAVDPQLRRIVALKVLLTGDRASEIERAKFVSEARITSQLEHPNIVPVHEMGLDDRHRHYFSMKLVRGRSLSTVLDDLALAGPEAAIRARIGLLGDFLKVCDAVGFAHARGVIHRDLKPANVMTGQFGEVLVMDWGLAKLVADHTSADDEDAPRPIDDEQDPALATLDGQMIGTPAYMSPEQAAGQAGQVDARSDIHALGGILYSILTLEIPYTGQTTSQVLEQVREGAFTPPTERAPQLQIPYELEAVVLKAMALEPAARYQSVARMRADIQAYLEGRVLSAARYNLPRLLWKWVRRHRAIVGASLAVLLVIVAALIRVTQARDEAERQRGKAVAAQRAIRVRFQLEKYQRKIAETRSYFYIRRIDLASRLSELDRALTELRGLSRQPRYAADPLLWLLLGTGAYYLGRHDAAEAALRQTLKRSPRDPWAHFYLGRIYSERGIRLQIKAGKSNISSSLWIKSDQAFQQLNAKTESRRAARRSIRVR